MLKTLKYVVIGYVALLMVLSMAMDYLTVYNRPIPDVGFLHFHQIHRTPSSRADTLFMIDVRTTYEKDDMLFVYYTFDEGHSQLQGIRRLRQYDEGRYQYQNTREFRRGEDNTFNYTRGLIDDTDYLIFFGIPEPEKETLNITVTSGAYTHHDTDIPLKVDAFVYVLKAPQGSFTVNHQYE